MRNSGAMSPGVEQQSIGDKLTDLQQEFAAQVERPQGGDPLIGEFYAGLRQVFESSGLNDIYAEAFARRPDLNAMHASGLARAAIQKQALRQARELDFPMAFGTKGDYAHLISTLLGDPAGRREFTTDIQTRNVQTNIADRGKGPKLLAMYYAERFDQPVKILDIGCGRNQMLKKIALTELPSVFYGRANIVQAPESTRRAGSISIDEQLTDNFNTTLAAGSLALGQCIGIDKVFSRRKSDVEWARSSFYPRELRDPATLEEFDLLETSRPSHIQFRKLNVLDDIAKAKDPREALGGFVPDIVLCSAMLYQLSPGQRRLVREAIHACLQPDGVAMYLEFAQVDPGDQSKLQFFRHWDPYTFRLIVEDMREPDVLQEALRWRDGRCSQAQLGLGRLIVKNSYETMEELLKQPLEAVP